MTLQHKALGIIKRMWNSKLICYKITAATLRYNNVILLHYVNVHVCCALIFDTNTNACNSLLTLKNELYSLLMAEGLSMVYNSYHEANTDYH